MFQFFKRHILLLLLLSILLFPNIVFAQNLTPFSDVSTEYPYFKAIQTFADEGIVIGYPDGTFKPDKEVTRAEFLKISFKYLTIFEPNGDQSMTNCFADTDDHWGEEYICYGAKYGIIQGDGDTGFFNPNRSVNFAEAAKIVDYTTAEVIYKSDPWYYESVKRLDQFKATPESVDYVFKNITRGEIVEILYRRLNGIETDQNFNIFAKNSESITWQYLNDFNYFKDTEIYDNDFNLIAQNITDINRIADPDCQTNCPLSDSSQVYFGSNILINVNLEKFDFLTENIAIDDEKIYYFSPDGYAGVIEGLDYNTFDIPSDYLLFNIDSEVRDSPFIKYSEIVQVMDENISYLLINTNIIGEEWKLHNKWRDTLNKNENIDLELRRLGDKDAALIVPNLDQNKILFYGMYHFVVGDKAYYINKEIKDVDIVSFEIFEGEKSINFSRDKNNVYFMGELIEGADSASFESLANSNWYYVDKDNIYNFNGQKLNGISSQNYEIILFANDIIYDEDQVFAFGYEAEGADPKTFNRLDYNCAIDAEDYFVRESNEFDNSYLNAVSLDKWLERCDLVN